MPSARGLALLTARKIHCEPMHAKPRAYTFPHRCPGRDCAICAWIRAHQHALNLKEPS